MTINVIRSGGLYLYHHLQCDCCENVYRIIGLTCLFYVVPSDGSFKKEFLFNLLQNLFIMEFIQRIIKYYQMHLSNDDKLIN